MQKPQTARVALALMDEHQVRDIQRNGTDVRQTFFQLLGNVIAAPAEACSTNSALRTQAQGGKQRRVRIR